MEIFSVKTMFKSYFLVGTAVVILGFFSTVFAQVFRYQDDADIPQWALASVEKMKEREIITGFGDGTFKPNKELNRAEALVIIFRTKGIDFEDSGRVKEIEFSDVPRGEWFSGAVIEAANRGWIKGFPDGTIRPEKIVNRAEWATLIMRAFELEKEEDPEFEDVPVGIWFAEPVFNLAANELIRERSNKFNPSDSVTRADAAWVISEIVEKPRLMGESKSNDFAAGNMRDARRTAIKPRDFNPEKQGFDIEKKQVSFDVIPREEELEVLLGSDWVDFGTIRVKNTLDDKVTLHSMELRLRFEATNQGPANSFLFQLRGGGIILEEKVNRTGTIFFGGIGMNIGSGEEKVFRAKLKFNPEESHYNRIGLGKISVSQADASMISVFNKENSERTGGLRSAPIGFENRDFAVFKFNP